ncbi:hypothetical protein [Xanthomonas albilineans]|uniref:hypothetical protein n=1 Tax=Xanthomonas albilineans TaxID=29447 RepID=UPI0005F30084|nr:hypothetical protein [Xanthomonas albilineans]
MPGPGDLWDGPEDDWEKEDAIDALIAEYRSDPEKVAEADEDCSGMQSPEHYSEIECALADLHDVHPSDLPGSDVLARLYRLSAAHAAAREERLRWMAEEAIEQQIAQGESNRAEYEADMEDAA